MIGQQVGRLSVIELTTGRGKGRRYLCRCECGKEVAVEAYRLKAGSVRSCGCLRRERAKAIGSKNRKDGTRVSEVCGLATYGRLRVEKVLDAAVAPSKAVWVCRCACGRLCEAKATSLVYGKKRSCGCRNVTRVKRRLYEARVGVLRLEKELDLALERLTALDKEQDNLTLFLACRAV